jgi:hypothetical protein
MNEKSQFTNLKSKASNEIVIETIFSVVTPAVSRSIDRLSPVQLPNFHFEYSKAAARWTAFLGRRQPFKS